MRAQHKQHNKRNIQNFALPAAGFLVVSGVTSVCAADEADEIVVTAQKREQALSDVPIAISALSRDDLEKRNYTGLEELTGAVPNLSISNYGGSLRANIRGVGQPSLNPGAEGATAMHLNGVFLSRTYEGGLTFADLDRIEILRGPQGTLYGRNATGGSINFISKRPSEEFEASFKATYGNYELIRTEGMVSGALTDRLLGRLVVGSENRRGYSLNLFDGEYYDDSNKRSARGTLLFNASDKMTFTLVADYHYENDGNYATHLMGEGVAGQTLAGVLAGGETTPLDANGSAIDARVLNIDSIPENKRHVGGVSLNAEWQLSDALKLVSISGYRRSKYRFTADFDATTTPFPSNEPDYNYVLEPETCAAIADLENIVAIKYSVDRERYAKLTDMSRGKLIVSTSSEDQWLENIVELGWQVYLCSTPPFLMQTAADKRMNEYTRLAMAGEVEKAREVRDSLDPVRKALKGTRPADKPQAQQKYWQELIGQVGGGVRRPLLNLTDEEKAAVKAGLDACGLKLS